MKKRPKPGEEETKSGLTRRQFLTTMGAGAAAVAVSGKQKAHAADEPQVVSADEKTRITFTLNGRRRRVMVEPRWSLLFVLRERLGMTGTKVGCERGECGACTVLINDVPRYACMTLAVEAEGAKITTIEGLMKGEELGSTQQAFAEEDAFQCGYCTPGADHGNGKGSCAQHPTLVRRDTCSHGRQPLPLRHLHAHRQGRETRRGPEAKNGRCVMAEERKETYYVEGIPIPETPQPGTQPKPWEKTNIIGKRMARVDAYDRVSGSAQFPSDVILPEMLYGAILRSPHPHARVKRIDTSEAEKADGVHAVLSGTSPEANIYWPYSREMRMKLFDPLCRYEGEPVAAVAAETPYQASDALRQIKVEYEILPFVVDERKALDQGAPLVHAGIASLPSRCTNGATCRRALQKQTLCLKRHTGPSARSTPLWRRTDALPSGTATVSPSGSRRRASTRSRRAWQRCSAFRFPRCASSATTWVAALAAS